MCPKTVHFEVKIIKKRKRKTNYQAKKKKLARRSPLAFWITPNKVYKYKINDMLEAHFSIGAYISKHTKVKITIRG